MRRIILVLALICFLLPISVSADEVREHYITELVNTTGGDVIVVGVHPWQGDIQPDAYFMRMDYEGYEQWHISLGGTGNDAGVAAAEAPDGATLILVQTDSSDGDMYDNLPQEDYNFTYTSILYMISATGEIQWRYPVPRRNMWIKDLEASDDGFLLIGHSYDEDCPWVMLIDQQQNELWEKRYTDFAGGMVYQTRKTRDNGFLHVGRFFTPIPDSNFHTSEAWVFRTNTQGEVIWEKKFFENSYDAFHDVMELDDGSIFLGGLQAESVLELSEENGSVPWLVKVSADGEMLWSKTLPGKKGGGIDNIRKQDGGYWLEVSPLGGGGGNMQPVYIDEDGNILR